MVQGSEKSSIQTKTYHNDRSLIQRVAWELSRNKYLYLLAIPIIAYYIIFSYFPIFGIVIAFQEYSLGQGFFTGKWVGLKYFIEYFNSIYFLRTLGNTIIISFMSLIFGFPVPIIFALMLNELRARRFKKIVQTVSYLPHFISMVVICGMIVDFFSVDGLITGLIQKLGGENINYIGDSRYFRSIYVGTGIWQSFGWNSIIYLSALAGVDITLYEASTIDGASRWKQLWHITLPGIMPTIVTLLILNLGGVLSVGYEKIILLYSSPTYKVADVISSYLYRTGILGTRFSYSTAVGLFQSVVNFAFLLLANRLSAKFTETSLF